MKKMYAVAMSLVLAGGLIAGCGSKDDNDGANNAPTASPAQTAPADTDVTSAEYANGVYYAEGDFDAKSGWKEIVALEVQDGKITSVNWNGLHKDGGIDKKTSSIQGKYGMKEKGNAQSEWYEQAEKMEQFLLEKQDPKEIAVKQDGKTDAISGVTFNVSGFTELVDKALKAGPVQQGPYKDGAYRAEGEFDANSGWKETVDLTVMNGNIVAVQWNGIHKDGGADKVTRSKDGEYGMKANGNAQAEWHEQALKAETYLLEKQDPAAIIYNEADGKTDAISGVSIHVNGFVELAIKALAEAK